MDRAAVLAAMRAHCGADQSLAARLNLRLGALADATDTWAEQAKTLSEGGMPARFFKGALAGALELPGDLALVQLPGARLVLLRHHNQRWQALNAVGEAVQDLNEKDLALAVQAVVVVAAVEIEAALAARATSPADRTGWPARCRATP